MVMIPKCMEIMEMFIKMFNWQTSDHIIIIKIHLIEDQWLILSSSRYPGNSNYLTHYKRWKSFWSLQIQFFSSFMEILYIYIFGMKILCGIPVQFRPPPFPVRRAELSDGIQNEKRHKSTSNHHYNDKVVMIFSQEFNFLL